MSPIHNLIGHKMESRDEMIQKPIQWLGMIQGSTKRVFALFYLTEETQGADEALVSF